MDATSKIRIVYILHGLEDDDQVPLIAFSDRDTAELLASRLNKYIEGGVTVKELPQINCELDIDKHALKVKEGQLPYYITLHKDGHLFDHWDLLGYSLDEQTLEGQAIHVAAMKEAELLDSTKQWGVGATYWAHTVGVANSKAEDHRQALLMRLKCE